MVNYWSIYIRRSGYPYWSIYRRRSGYPYWSIYRRWSGYPYWSIYRRWSGYPYWSIYRRWSGYPYWSIYRRRSGYISFSELAFAYTCKIIVIKRQKIHILKKIIECRCVCYLKEIIRIAILVGPAAMMSFIIIRKKVKTILGEI
jgi:L-amino acid N-acyltransferase YncA